jgi:signal transduction histidine kinase
MTLCVAWRRLFQAQLEAPGHAKISCVLQLDPLLEPVAADAELLHRAISNLVLNAMDAMPHGWYADLAHAR